MSDALLRSTQPASKPRRALRAALYIVGALLLGGAVWFALRDRDAAWAAWRHARTAPWWHVGALLVAPVVSWGLTSWMFAALTRRYARVGTGEMSALIGASWLLNYLPFRPGLVGRVAYLKAVHGVPVAEALVINVLAVGATLAAAAIGLCAWLVARGAPSAGLLGVGLPLAGVVVAGVIGVLVFRSRAPASADLCLALVLRTLDMMLAAARLWLAFGLIGTPISATEAVFLAGPSQVVGLLPIQLGTVEWTVGLLSAATSEGVTAAVVNRSADLLVSLVVGTASMLMLARARARIRAT
ncbi:MAG: hypothetical protein AB7K52_10895 [Phycisphaerales bacterium]